MSICKEKGHLPKCKWYLSRAEGIMDNIFYFVCVFFLKKKNVFAMSICYFNNQTMMALNKRGQNEDSFFSSK